MNIQIDVFKESGKWVEDRVIRVHGNYLYNAVDSVQALHIKHGHPYTLVTVLGSHARDQIGLSRLIITTEAK